MPTATVSSAITLTPVPAGGRGRLFDHAVRRRVPVRRPTDPAPRRHVPADAPRLRLRQVPPVAVPGVGRRRPGLRPEPIPDLIGQPHRRTSVTRVQGRLRRDNQPMFAIHGHLRTVALLEPLRACPHNGAVGVGEVALRLPVRLQVGTLVRPPALGGIALPSGLVPVHGPKICRRMKGGAEKHRHFLSRAAITQCRSSRSTPGALRRSAFASRDRRP